MRFLLLGALALSLGCSSLNTPMSEANPGVRAGRSATFSADHSFDVTIPERAGAVDLWFALPSARDRMQVVSDLQIDTGGHPHSVVSDNHGNRFLFVHLDDPKPGRFDVRTTFDITRSEVRADVDPAKTRPHTGAELAVLSRYLVDSSQSVIDDDARAMARRAVGEEKNPILASRKIYDAILGHVDYHVKDSKPDSAKTMHSTGKGSSQLCFASCTGNCTDFHSLYSAVSRAAGIPTRVVYGSFFKGPLDGVDKDQSYHCWVEFHAPNIGWVPLDVAVADIFVADFIANDHSRSRADLTVANGYHGPDADLVDYYFGNIDERRVTWHWGRDLTMIPPQQGGPLLWNPKAYAEVDGKAASIVQRKLTYHEKK